MQESSSPGSEAEVERAALAHDAYALAERYRDGELSRDQALDELRTRYPGLSQGRYQDAFSHALFASR
jgi:hypothetical protein